MVYTIVEFMSPYISSVHMHHDQSSDLIFSFFLLGLLDNEKTFSVDMMFGVLPVVPGLASKMELKAL